MITCSACAANPLCHTCGPHEDVRLFVYADGHATLAWVDGPDPISWDPRYCDGLPFCQR